MMTPSLGKLPRLSFDNRFVRVLPGDPESKNVPRQVTAACYSNVNPQPVPSPELVAFSREAAALIGLDEASCTTPLFADVFSGHRLLPGMVPFAMCYGGHQFGHWAGQLGDGRAINLGEVINDQGRRWMIQLKGAGPTPYSRTADGFAVLRSSVREFLCSEAMHHLGIPTTRALSLILTGNPVIRDMFYDGNPKAEPGAVVTRLSPTFTRFGNFEILAARREYALLKRLMDYTIETDFPHLDRTAPDIYLTWFREICRSTMSLMVHFLRVGFVHGVMNTDNMSISGLTIDYGPYGFLEPYDPAWTPNTTDAEGRRYSFGNQPGIALWNLSQLGNALLPVINDTSALQRILDDTVSFYEGQWTAMMGQKLGLGEVIPDTDPGLIEQALSLIQATETDYTLFFRGLADFDPRVFLENYSELPDFLVQALYSPEAISDAFHRKALDWLGAYARRILNDGRSAEIRRAEMNRINPRYILRNYLAQQAIDRAEQGDFSLVWQLLDLLRHPYDTQPGMEEFSRKRPEWARHRPGCAMLSCSS